MKNKFISSFRNYILSTVGDFLWKKKAKSVLTKDEIKICKDIHFSYILAAALKGCSKNNLKYLPKIDIDLFIEGKNELGICTEIEKNKGLAYTLELRQGFKEMGHTIFVFEDNENCCFLASIKSTDELDILRWRNTEAGNHRLENEDIVRKMKHWKNENDLKIIGVGSDWIQFHFLNLLPQNLKIFAKEIYEFCPDIVDQGTGTIQNLIKEIKRMNGVYLWWD